MNSETRQVDDLKLVALPSAVNCTEIFVRFTLAEWSLTALIDEVLDAATRLVNTMVEDRDTKSPGLLSVRLRLHGDAMVIELEGTYLARPPAQAPELDNARTGVVPRQDGVTHLWCELALPEGLRGTEVPLPRRDPKKSTAPAADDEPADMDPQLMQRILSSLGGNSSATGNPQE